MQRRLLLVLAVALSLGACATKPVPDGYTGPLAKVADTETSRSSTAADFFYLDKIDGRKIQNGLGATQSANAGRGFQMTPVSFERDIPAMPATYSIVGRTHYAAPILEMTNTVYKISGDTQFTPLPNHNYLVKGVMGETYSAIWIEDGQTGEQVGRKIEVQGSTALGFLEK